MHKKIFAFLGIGSLIIPVIILLISFVVTVTILGAVLGANQFSNSQYYDGVIPEAVTVYQPLVDKYCKQYGIPEYVPLVFAVMQQESGGAEGDPMQCSESPNNLDYPHVPGGITNPEYSIKIGIQYLSSCLRAAGCKSPKDMPAISLALQGYNFGGGYINWALAKGGYTQANAIDFSQMKAKQLGKTSYGDSMYVSHVLRYYSSSATAAGDGYFNSPLALGTYNISSGYGYRWGKLHKGIDFAAPEGTKIYAAASGTVVFASFGLPGSGFGGYGNVVLIKHNNTYSTLYGHCSQLLVTAGTTVKKGSIIALVGNTGDSTGDHCHFEIQVNGTATNPIPYLNKSEKID